MMISLPVDPQVMCIELSEHDQLWVTDDAYHITYIFSLIFNYHSNQPRYEMPSFL